MKVKISKSIFLILWILGISMVNAQGLKDLSTGYTHPGPDPALISTSGIGTGGWVSAYSFFLNPALASDQKLTVSFSVTGFRIEERRAFPVYDRFDGIVTQGTYVINNNTYTNFTYVVRYNLSEKVSTAIFSLPFKSFEYDYYEQVRDNIFGDFVVARNMIRGSGMLYLSGINGSFRVMENLRIGLNLGLLNKPTLHFLQESVWVDSTNAFYSIERNRKITSVSPFVNLGVHYTLNPRWAFGFSLQLPVKVKLQTNQTNQNPFAQNPLPADMQYDEEFSYPMTIRGGLEYRAQTPFRTRLLMDYSYSFWSRVDVLQAGQSFMHLDDTYKVGAALELQFLHKNRFLISYNYQSVPWDKTLAQADVGIGLGIPIPHGIIHAGIRFSKRSYKEYDLFPDQWFGGDRSFSPLDDVDENYILGGLGVTFYLK